MLISEGLFAAANIFSNLKLVYIFSVNPYLGPLQVSLSRMVVDILKFTSLFFLVLFAFSCGKLGFKQFTRNKTPPPKYEATLSWDRDIFRQFYVSYYKLYLPKYYSSASISLLGIIIHIIYL